MAQVFPLNVEDLTTPDGQPTLAGTLAALPEPWTLLRDRRIGAAAAEPVQIVLVHPEIGIALVDEAPRDPAPESAALRSYLEGARFDAYFPGDLPIVTLSVAAEDFAAVGERLAAAFDAAPRLSIADGDWADAVIELLLVPDDLAMAPVGGAGATPPSEPAVPPSPSEWPREVPEWARVAPETPPERFMGPPLDPGEIPLPLMVDWPFATSYRPKRRWGVIAAVLVGTILLAGAGVAAWQLGEDMTLPGAETTQRAQVEIPLPPPPRANRSVEAPPTMQKPPPVPAAPPVVLAQKPLASPPPAPPVPTRVEPLPETAANVPPPATIAPPAPAAPPATAAAPPPSPPSPPPSQTAAAPAPTTPPAPAQTAASPGPQPSSQAAAEPPPAAKPPPRAAAAAKPKPPPRIAKVEPVAPKAPGPLGRPQQGGGPPIDAQDLPPLDDVPAAKAPLPVETAAPSSAPPAAGALGPPVPLRALPASGSMAPGAATAVPNPRECRPYTSNTTLTGRGAAVQGIACRGPDGQWRLVSEVPVR
ncbi:MAG TPA: hypothetical protein VF502_10315 [Stellaceae bacterium]